MTLMRNLEGRGGSMQVSQLDTKLKGYAMFGLLYELSTRSRFSCYIV